MNNPMQRIPQKFWAFTALLAWGALCYLLLNKSPYGIDEGAARALLLVWSVTDDVVSPVVTLGFPDFRALFFAPVGYLWVGNIVAAKVFTLLVMSGAVWSLYRWRQHSGHSESALLASGLLLLSPLLVRQIDTISVAPYLLFIFALGAWADRMYHDSPQAFGGMYFLQILLCLMSVTLHPIGMAYPLALLWGWYKTPPDTKHRKHFLVGIVFVVIFALLLTLGWHNTEWFANPIRSLSGLLLGTSADKDIGIFRWMAGLAVLGIAFWVVWKQAGILWADMLGRTLMIGLVIGLVTGDEIWGIVVLATSLYWGLPLLIPTSAGTSGGFWAQRGIAMTLFFVLSTTFMLTDKAYYQAGLDGYISPRDSLIKTLAEDRGDFSGEGTAGQGLPDKRPVRVASQWPGLTMLACRCDALPLPPPGKDSGSLFAMLKGIDYLIFDPRDPRNKLLARNLATMDAGKVETVALQRGGVIVATRVPQTGKSQ